ncbi:MAG TPA: transglutaminase-like domain-containing protein [Blastocatellia bacterium]|nr:transglutaminase-like domain-containing protein [Blastocatellia bacterium]
MLQKSFTIIAIIAALTIAALADDAPAWLRQAASGVTPSYDKKVPAVVLLDESRVTITDEGKVKTVNTFAIKILTKEGRGAAVAHEAYQTNTGKLRELKAWLLPTTGKVREYGKRDYVDEAAADNDVYNEYRIRSISATNEAQVGDVFGYESTCEETTVFTQFDWTFQGRLPVVASRFIVTSPDNWNVESITFNHAKVAPIINGRTQMWELHNLPPIEPCPNAPPLSSVVPRLAVNLFPPANAKTTYGRSFKTWADVSAWTFELTDGQANVNDALAAKAKALTSSASTEFEKVQAIARYAQSVRYISIQTNIARGGGYRPHAATEVLAKNYGDCKDKANLMRAMLRAIGIESYLVSIYSGDPTYVRAEWPSPQQFNHCIIAVKVSAATNAEAIVQHATLGRLLIFDPTDEHTPFGTLPDHEQDSLALIIAGANGALLKMPTATETVQLERTVEATLTAEGTLTATLREQATGAMAAYSREEFKSLSETDYRKRIESFIARGVPRAHVTKIKPQDASPHFQLEVELTAAEYAQNLQNKLLLFKPALLHYREAVTLSETKREQPILLDADSRHEIIRITLPPGYAIDELPDAQTIKESFGQCELKYEVKDGTVIYSRTIRLKKETIPASQAEQVKSFFARIKAAEQAPVVLLRK